MKVAAITRFKQGDLWAALQKLGWSQSEFARRLGSDPTTIGRCINLRQRPKQELMDRIQEVFAENDIYLDPITIWPEDFVGFDKSPTMTQIKDVPIQMITTKEMNQIADVNGSTLEQVIKNEKKDALLKAMHRLSFREREIIKLRYGLGQDSTQYTLNEVGRIFKVTSERIKQIERKAMQKLQKDGNFITEIE